MLLVWEHTLEYHCFVGKIPVNLKHQLVTPGPGPFCPGLPV